MKQGGGVGDADRWGSRRLLSLLHFQNGGWAEAAIWEETSETDEPQPLVNYASVLSSNAFEPSCEIKNYATTSRPPYETSLWYQVQHSRR